jgi:predicted HTH transcriptional regulator
VPVISRAQKSQLRGLADLNKESNFVMTDLILNTTRLARKTDPATSHAAAARVGEFSRTHAASILRCLKQLGPGTADEIAEMTYLKSQAVNKRLPELARLGLAAPTGELRPSDSGRLARVWGVA